MSWLLSCLATTFSSNLDIHFRHRPIVLQVVGVQRRLLYYWCQECHFKDLGTWPSLRNALMILQRKVWVPVHSFYITLWILDRVCLKYWGNWISLRTSSTLTGVHSEQETSHLGYASDSWPRSILKIYSLNLDIASLVVTTCQLHFRACALEHDGHHYR